MKSGDTLSAYYLKYDLIRNHLEIINENQIRTIKGSLINKFEWYDADQLKAQKFINSSNFNKVDDKAFRFFEIIEEGKILLLTAKKVISIVGSTSPTLAKQSDSDMIQTLQKYFFALDKSVHEISRKKKNNLKFLNSIETQNFILKKKLKFNNTEDLSEIVAFYNRMK